MKGVEVTSQCYLLLIKLIKQYCNRTRPQSFAKIKEQIARSSLIYEISALFTMLGSQKSTLGYEDDEMTPPLGKDDSPGRYFQCRNTVVQN